MPYRPGRQCPGRGPYINQCPNVVKGKGPYCRVCNEYFKKELKRRNRVYDRERDQTRERKFIHSPQWRKIRKRKLAQDPLCEKCLEVGRETMAVLVHHIDGDELNNEPSNHLSMCSSCHEAVHKPHRWGRK